MTSLLSALTTALIKLLGEGQRRIIVMVKQGRKRGANSSLWCQSHPNLLSTECFSCPYCITASWTERLCLINTTVHIKGCVLLMFYSCDLRLMFKLQVYFLLFYAHLFSTCELWLLPEQRWATVSAEPEHMQCVDTVGKEWSCCSASTELSLPHLCTQAVRGCAPYTTTSR